jgi:hypothetical protein
VFTVCVALILFLCFRTLLCVFLMCVFEAKLCVFELQCVFRELFCVPLTITVCQKVTPQITELLKNIFYRTLIYPILSKFIKNDLILRKIISNSHPCINASSNQCSLFVKGSGSYVKTVSETSVLSNIFSVVIEAFRSAKRQKNLIRQKERERA